MARDIGENEYWPELYDKQYYIDRNSRMKRYYLEQLNNLKLPIYIIGGLTKIKPEEVEDLEFINVAVPSFQELIIPDYTQYEILFQHVLWMIPYNISKELLDYVWEEHKIWTYAQAQPPFVLDKAHPNREAHKKLAKFINKKIMK